MKRLVLGGAGMLGHKVLQCLKQAGAETYCTIRSAENRTALESVGLFCAKTTIENFDATDFAALEKLLEQNKPDVVINCVGIIKQRGDAKKAIPSIEINALLPHKLASVCQRRGARLIHFSTDCVFSGKTGGYSEEDRSDAEDLYGRTKFLGEVDTPGTLTLRTSIIGRELAHYEALLEWLLRQNHKHISGFTRAMFSGVTTNYLARIVKELVCKHPTLSGLYQVTSPTISKYDLLGLLKDAYQLDIEITPDADFFCDRSMKGGKFVRATGLICPTWPELVADLAIDDTSYAKWE